ncbi:TadE/TadG family type IV pilus assembly protein [Pseudactinotalea terrae]|uniref:TadE/TadG family type IV pilus assembly protein n=1 Tax=Pseudactinotalea terrae TaxID=1743262 RepID=UPI001F50387A|nr:TadE/TadG family type IV pilus assembly protein [Pseudactinotalea terrae]
MVDFLLVSLLLTVLVLGVVQLALALHVRTMLTDAAAEGARYAALHGSDLAAGEARTAELIAMTLPDRYAQEIETGYDTYGDVTLVTVTVSAPLPVLGLFGPSGTVVVTGRAVDE